MKKNTLIKGTHHIAFSDKDSATLMLLNNTNAENPVQAVVMKSTHNSGNTHTTFYALLRNFALKKKLVAEGILNGNKDTEFISSDTPGYAQLLKTGTHNPVLQPFTETGLDILLQQNKIPRWMGAAISQFGMTVNMARLIEHKPENQIWQLAPLADYMASVEKSLASMQSRWIRN